MNEHGRPSMILRGGRIRTLDIQRPSAESLAIQHGQVVAVGTEDDILAITGPGTVIIDLRSRVVLPGLTDAHIHLKQYALSLSRIDCETPTKKACLERVRARAEATPVGKWIEGHGWNQNEWGRYGTAADLDSVAPDHPVFLTAKSLHAAWANSMALSRAHVTSSTADPPKGLIQRDAQGNPTGILFESAVKLVSSAIPNPSPDQLADTFVRTQQNLWRFGLTGIHDFDDPLCLEALQLLHRRRELGLRVVKHLPVDELQSALESGLRTGFGDAWIRVGNVKVFSDGALGPRTAAMLSPYEQEPDNCGLSLVDEAELYEIFKAAGEGGLAMAVHAIGDRANRQVLDAYEALRQHEAERGLPHLRHRIEHLQILHPDDLERPARLGIVASMQPVHATSDMSTADQHWGRRVRYAYAWRSLQQAGTVLAFGSDAPVEVPNPFWGLHAATTRQTRDGRPDTSGWVPQERLRLEEALRAYTLGPAYSAGMEAVLGKLAPGCVADLIILDQDPFACSPEELVHLSPVATMVDGAWRYRTFE